MNVQAAIARAALPETYVVCGTRLKPFSIGHWLTLQRFDVSFVGESDHTLGDLLIGILVCSDTYEGFIESLRAGEIDRAMKQWQYNLSGRLWGVLCRWWKRLRNKIVEPHECLGIDLAAACEQFQSYVNEHGGGLIKVNEWSVPVTKSVQGEAMQINAPALAVLLDALISECGMNRSEVLNMSLPAARWHWAVHAERKGWVNLMDVDEMKEDRRMADEFAAAIFNAQQNENGVN